MRRIVKAGLVALILSVGLVKPVVAGLLENGVAAYDQGDYATALRLWHSLADQGHGGAQTRLGDMYAQGMGVSQNNVTAYMWYSVAGNAKERDMVSNLMTPSQIAEAKLLAREWKMKRSKP